MIIAVWIRAVVLRLAGHAVDGRATDAADADAGTERGESGGQAGADETKALAGRGGGGGGFLQQGEHVQHVRLQGKTGR